MPFEHPFGSLMTGTISHQVLDPHGIRPPSNIIQLRHDWGVQVDWEINGIAAWTLGGDWQLEVFVESIGPGPEQSLGTATVPLINSLPPPPRKYTHTFNVPGTPPPPAPPPGKALPVGTYRLVTLITHTCGGVHSEIAAYDDKTIVQIYKV